MSTAQCLVPTTLCLGSSHSAVAQDVVTEHAQNEAAAALPPAMAVKDTFNSQDVSVSLVHCCTVRYKCGKFQWRMQDF